jgi:hypothetical protein
MSEARIVSAATECVNQLFINGQGQRAERLVLTSQDGRDLGGWGRGPVIDHVVEAIEAAEAAKEP